MKGLVIEFGGGHGPDAMSNSVCICDCVLKGKEDGDRVTFEGEGVIVEHEGKRYIAVDLVDGEPVEEMEGYEEEPSREDMMSMDSNEALDNFIERKNNY